jgi:DNA-binding CsgD family transcriptional regulator
VAEKLGLSIHTVEKYVTQAKARIRTMSWER